MTTSTAIRREIPFAAGLQILSSVQEGGEAALSEYASCIVPLLNALRWRGEERHLAEAVPHFSENLDLDGVIDLFANLSITMRPVRIRLNRLEDGMIPCLFVPDTGSVQVIIADDLQGLRIYDASSRSESVIEARSISGTAYIARQVSEQASETAGQLSWVSRLFFRFSNIWLTVFLITGAFNVLSLATPLFIMVIYDGVIPSGSTTQLMFFVVGILCAFGFELVFRFLRARLLAHIAGRIDYAIGTATFRQVLHLPALYTEGAPVGGQLARLREFESVREFFTGPLAEALLDLPFVVLFLAVIALIGGVLVVVPIVMGIAFVVLHLLMAPGMRRAVASSGRHRSELQQMMVETISGIRTLKLSARYRNWIDRYRAVSADAALAEFRNTLLTNAINALSQAMMLSAGMALVCIGAFLAMNGELSMGALIAVMALGWRSLSPLQSGFLALNRAEQLRTAFRQINALLRLNPERLAGHVPPRRAIYGELSFVGVSHRYSGETDPVLLGITFSISPGEVVMVTGRNGSGKSTLLKLASGLYRVQSGAVMVDGTDIRQIDPIDLRQNIGVMPQEPEFFYGTINQNLRMAVPTATDEQIRAVTKEALAHDEILALPDGFETRLNERLLSELPIGFRQKLSLSRALLRNSRLLILDEPGQALDQLGDAALIDAIENRRGRTSILMVTHRPTHLRRADRVIVLEHGRIDFNGPSEAYFKKLEMGARG